MTEKVLEKWHNHGLEKHCKLQVCIADWEPLGVTCKLRPDVKQSRRQRESEERKKGISHVKASFVRNVSQNIIRKSSRVANNRECCTSNGAI